MTDHHVEIPPSLAARPHDPRRHLPIPPVSTHSSDGVTYVDFTVVNGPVAARLAVERMCSLCGTEMDYWVAFLGTPTHLKSRRYLDPPAHPDCMRAAVVLCPFIAYRAHRRASARHVRAEGGVPPGYLEGTPDEWVLGVTRQYRVEREGLAMVYIAAPFKTLTYYRYDSNGRIQA